AVALDVDRQPAVPLVRERGPHRRARAVAHPARALSADVLVVLVEVPEAVGPLADEPLPRHERPVLALDLRPQLGGQARDANGTGVPAVRGGLPVLGAGPP